LSISLIPFIRSLLYIRQSLLQHGAVGLDQYVQQHDHHVRSLKLIHHDGHDGFAVFETFLAGTKCEELLLPVFHKYEGKILEI